MKSEFRLLEMKCRLEAMKSQNEYAVYQGYCPAYGKDDFLELAKEIKMIYDSLED